MEIIDKDFESFCQRNSYIPSQKHYNFLNKFFQLCKLSGVFENAKAAYFHGAETEAIANANLFASTNTLTKTGVITYIPIMGIKPNGSSGYLDTGINPSTDTVFTQNSCQIISVIRDNINEDAIDVGFGGNANGGWLSTRWSTNLSYSRLGGATSYSFANSDSRGIWALKRASSSAYSVITDSDEKLAQTSTSVIPANDTIKIGGGLSGLVYFSTKTQFLTIIGNSVITNSIIERILEICMPLLGTELRTDYWFGDSMILGTGAVNTDSNYAAQYCNAKKISIVNNGVGGQTSSAFVATWLGLLPTYNPKMDKKSRVRFNWGINDPQNTISVATTISNLLIIVKRLMDNGWPPSQIDQFDGWYMDNANVTDAVYLQYVNAAGYVARITGINLIPMRSFLMNNGGMELVSSTDWTHLNQLGHDRVTDFLLQSEK